VSADVVRSMYAALERGDVNAFVGLLHPDIEWTVPGRHDLAGTFVSVPALLAHLAEVAQRTGGQIKVDVVDILESGRHVAAVAEVDMSVDRRTTHDRQVHLFEFRDGRIASVTEYHGNEQAFEDLFGAAR
jgi:uncharacterized protein